MSRLLAGWLLAMKNASVIETEFACEVLDDPQMGLYAVSGQFGPAAMRESGAMIEVGKLGKPFTLHSHLGAVKPVFEAAVFSMRPSEWVALTDKRGLGKSTILRILHDTCLAGTGALGTGGRDLTRLTTPRDLTRRTTAREFMALWREALGYVSRFLRVMPRGPKWEPVAEPLLAPGVAEDAVGAVAKAHRDRLRMPQALRPLSPTAFPGGKARPRCTARGFAHGRTALFPDTPTAGLDPANRETRLTPIEEAQANGAATPCGFHDADGRDRAPDGEINPGACALAVAA